MTRSFRIVLAVSLALVAACGDASGDDDDDDDTADGGVTDPHFDGGGASGDFGPGTYASRELLSSLVDLPLSDEPGEMTTTTIARYVVTDQGGALQAEAEVCAVEQDGALGVQPVLSEAFVAAIPKTTAAVTVTTSGTTTEVAFGRTLYVLGAELADADNDELPTTADDERVRDHDGDTHPGVTVRLTGLITGDLYIVQRTRGGLEGTVLTDGSVAGSMLGDAEQTRIGVSDPLLEAVELSPSKNPDPQASTFVMVPIDPTMSCAAIAADADTLFAAQ